MSILFPPLAAAFDITSKCPLDCAHCYLPKRSDNDLADAEWQSRILKIKKEHPLLLRALWLWGEPLLRKELLIELMKRFRYNSVFTSGSIPFSGLPENCVIQVSVDGTEEIHDRIRWSGSFARAVSNMSSHPSGKFTIAMTVNKWNRNVIGQVVDRFVNSRPRILAMHFVFHTSRGISDPMGLSFSERIETVKEISELRKKYGSFVMLAPKMGKLLENQDSLMRWCPFITGSAVSFDSMWNRKSPCWYGKSLCSHCGCSMAFEASTKNFLSLESTRQMFRTFRNFP